MDIKRLLSQKESETLEFKETLRMKEEIGAAVSAFSSYPDDEKLENPSNESKFS